MKFFALLTTFFVAFIAANLVHAQAPNWQWAKHYGGPGNDWGGNIATDATGNAYVVGVFSGSVGFGTDTLISAGAQDIFIIKYNPAGSILWVKSYGGTGDENGTDISVTPGGDIYISGIYNGASPFGTVVTTSSAVFIAKLDNAGAVQWTRANSANRRSDKLFSMSLDMSGNIVIGGFFYGKMILGNDTLTAHGNSAPFVAKYDSNGNVLWAQSIYSNGYSSLFGLSTGKDEDIYIAGTYQDTIKFDNIRLVGGDVFLARLRKNGTAVWAKNIVGDIDSRGYGVASDDDKNVFLTGSFRTEIKFDNLVVTETNWGPDDFLAKYDSSGNPLWAQKTCHSTYGSLARVVVDSWNNLYIYNIYIDSIKTGTTTSYLQPGGFAPYILKLDNNGSSLWGVTATGKRASDIFSIALASNGDIYMAGSIIDSIKCGSTMMKTNGGDHDIFVAKLSDDPNAVSGPITNPHELTIYPQPSNGKVHIAFEQKGMTQVVIVDQLGRMVYSQPINRTATGIEVDLSHVTSGFYYAHFTGDHLSTTRKILIQH